MDEPKHFMLVKRDVLARDLGIFTGSMMLVESSHELWTEQFLVLGDADVSADIEHAFAFPSAWQAWRWSDRLMPDTSFTAKGVAFMSWDVRTFGDFHLGEVRPWGVIRRLDMRAQGLALTLGAA